ncbi:sensor domain-containing diguanylate cyclase [uncultured Roseovarius sp.]|uniref:sensor domain-containing diguanylate cyclase n=1 Tax=uncultured Roseovarius sp. TaxID=293344 RepID=UPI002639B1EB|nr:sensor domain-containing diguanylate cyclase [uncultured Roseovarius sp.]
MTDGNFFRKIPVGVACVDRDGSWLKANQRLCDTLGLTEDTLQHLRIHHVTHPDDLEPELTQMALLLRQNHGSFNMAKRFIRGDGSIFWADLNVSLVQASESQDTHFIMAVQDISETRQLIDHLEHKLRHDPLTRIRNRAGFTESVRAAFRRYERHGKGFALAYIDLDDFKKINDTLGHVGGDMLLKEVAGRLTHMIGQDGIVARIGGDEFAVVLNNAASMEQLNAAIFRLNSVFSVPMETSDRHVTISASVGLARCPLDAHSIHGLMQFADASMYAEKSAKLAPREIERSPYPQRLKRQQSAR